MGQSFSKIQEKSASHVAKLSLDAQALEVVVVISDKLLTREDDIDNIFPNYKLKEHLKALTDANIKIVIFAGPDREKARAIKDRLCISQYISHTVSGKRYLDTETHHMTFLIEKYPHLKPLKKICFTSCSMMPDPTVVGEVELRFIADKKDLAAPLIQYQFLNFVQSVTSQQKSSPTR